MPVIDDVIVALRAFTFWMDTFRTVPARAGQARPRLPRRMKMGAWTPSIVTFAITTPSMLAPSDRLEGDAGDGAPPLVAGCLVTLLKATFLRSPLDSVPN